MFTKSQPDHERKLADQKLLLAMLHRSDHSGADLHARSGRRYAREVIVIDRLRNGMVIIDMLPALWETLAFNEAAALLRWEDDGGSQGGVDAARMTGKHVA